MNESKPTLINTLRLHHVGLVVADIKVAISGFARSLATEPDSVIYEDPIQKVKVTFLSVGPAFAPSIELVQPASDDSPVRRFLNEKKGGMHHLCYEVDDINGALIELRARGNIIISSPKPAVAFNGRLIAWLFTRENLLIELLQSGHTSADITS